MPARTHSTNAEGQYGFPHTPYRFVPCIASCNRGNATGNVCCVLLCGHPSSCRRYCYHSERKWNCRPSVVSRRIPRLLVHRNRPMGLLQLLLNLITGEEVFCFPYFNCIHYAILCQGQSEIIFKIYLNLFWITVMKLARVLLVYFRIVIWSESSK